MGQKIIGRRTVLTGAVGMLAAPAIVRAQGQNGVALVIGNSKYQWEASLPNVKRDAPDIVARFQAMGLKTEFLLDAGKDAMHAALDKFKRDSRRAKLAAFYFAGHGVAWEKQTHVVPVDADLGDPKMAQGLISVAYINGTMKEAANRLLVFDSCRNNPVGGRQQFETSALARVDIGDQEAAQLAESNTLTLFSTASGAVALDGPPGENSPFAAAFMRQIEGETVDLQALPSKLRRDLLIATECRQLVWDQNTYTAPFAINGSGKSSANRKASYDPSRVVELPNAYAYVQQNALMLPSGVIAFRPAKNSRDARMTGSFRYELPASKSANSREFVWTPAVVNVLSMDGPERVVTLGSNKDWSTGRGSRWRFGYNQKIENGFVTHSVNGLHRYEWTWKDQNTGSYVIISRWPGEKEPTRSKVIPFTRLDG